MDRLKCRRVAAMVSCFYLVSLAAVAQGELYFRARNAHVRNNFNVLVPFLTLLHSTQAANADRSRNFF